MTDAIKTVLMVMLLWSCSLCSGLPHVMWSCSSSFVHRLRKIPPVLSMCIEFLSPRDMGWRIGPTIDLVSFSFSMWQSSHEKWNESISLLPASSSPRSFLFHLVHVCHCVPRRLSCIWQTLTIIKMRLIDLWSSDVVQVSNCFLLHKILCKIVNNSYICTHRADIGI